MGQPYYTQQGRTRLPFSQGCYEGGAFRCERYGRGGGVARVPRGSAGDGRALDRANTAVRS